ncbi:MAG: hypothetical protein MJ229_05325 [bacterium]|nr:hypothetical protein [bacterium]
MQILEVKNNLVKITYDVSKENLVLSSFVIIKNETQAFIAQVISLDSVQDKNTAVAKLLFNFDSDGVITNYNGSTPSMNSMVATVLAQELLELFQNENPIFMGEVAQQNINLVLDRAIFEQKLLVCAEKQGEKELLVHNFVTQLSNQNKKVVVVDLFGNLEYDTNKVVAGVDFKLPLNYQTINFIYEKGLDDASGETKATIQEVFLEVQNYVKTLDDGYLPFEDFKNVVDSQYEELELVELLLLKNKLLKFYDKGVFAQNADEFKVLANHIENENLTVLDLSKMDNIVQREMISYLYSLIEQENEDIYVVLNIEDDISDKKLLKQIFTNKIAKTIPICQYSYKYLKELKQISKNLILFAPIQQQTDFAGYNVFFNKLNAQEYIVYGEITHHIPLIIRLKEIPPEFNVAQEEKQIEEMPVQSQPEPQVEDVQQEVLQEEVLAEEEPVIDEPLISEEMEQVEEIEEPIIEEENNFDIDSIDSVDNIDNIEQIDNNIEEPVSEEDMLYEQVSQDVDEMIIAPKKIDSEEVLEEPEILNPDELTEDDLDFIEENIDSGFQENDEFSTEIIADDSELLEGVDDESFADVLSQGIDETEDSVSLQSSDILPAENASTPIVPVYPSEVEQTVQSDDVVQGDSVIHPKYGKGVVEKLISYGEKTLCSINFENVGRRLLDPNITEIKKI